ncbi:MAG: phosphopantetheine-binding protein [Planctomycetota bacterium]
MSVGPEAAALHDELRGHIIETLELDEVTPEEIGAETPFFGEGLGLDSIDAVELVAMLEAKYDIRLTEMETTKAAFTSLGTLSEFIVAHRKRGA